MVLHRVCMASLSSDAALVHPSHGSLCRPCHGASCSRSRVHTLRSLGMRFSGSLAAQIPSRRHFLPVAACWPSSDASSLRSAPQAQHGGGPALPLSSGAGVLRPSSGSWMNLPLVAELDDGPGGGALKRASLSQIFGGDAAF